MAGHAQGSFRSRWLLSGAACLLLGGGGLFVWRSYSPETEPAKQTGIQIAQPGMQGIPDSISAEKTNRKSSRGEESVNEAAERQMGAWLEDANVSPPEAARRIWRLATDPNYSLAVRKDALSNALNLAEDQQFQEEFLADLGKNNVWSGDLGEALLDDLYNRDNRVKIAAVAALLPDAQGEFQEHLREVLRFQLEATDADDATLLRLAMEQSGKSEKAASDQ